MEKVIVNWALCDGNGSCALEAPEVFEMNDDDELEVLVEDVDASRRSEVVRAMDACPKHALTLQ